MDRKRLLRLGICICAGIMCLQSEYAFAVVKINMKYPFSGDGYDLT